MLTRTLFIGLAAGAIAGAVAATVQATLMQPQIVQAEALEASQTMHDAAVHQVDDPSGGHTHPQSEEPSDDPLKRHLGTVIAIVCTAIGYGLILSSVIALSQRRGWRFGLLLGAVGFVSMQLAPALGAPPQPPGLPSYDVHVWQLWWLLAAGCTAAACLLVIDAVQVRRPAGLALCTALALLPHVVRPLFSAMGPLPEAGQLTSAFALSSFATSAVLWLSLGAVVGALHSRALSPS
ncbi:CbtA family protein [Piscinibacter sp.]|uniref:CbtA family protein n=1 Tax=Piscinibacter sp. TaxID=1903157 RepID=UPI002B8D3C0F|nr:CbtA family protein [Albitalea sp.]HUG25810.1 CbtA family protein [Albitalea sp.]